jgi:hypothetical protein
MKLIIVAAVIALSPCAANANVCYDFALKGPACSSVQICTGRSIELPRRCATDENLENIRFFYETKIREHVFAERTEFDIGPIVTLHHSKGVPRDGPEDREYALAIYNHSTVGSGWTAFLRRMHRASAGFEVDAYWRREIAKRVKATRSRTLELPGSDEVIAALAIDDLIIDEKACPALVDQLAKLEVLKVEIPRLIFGQNELERITIALHARSIELSIWHWSGSLTISSQGVGPSKKFFDWGLNTMEALEPCWRHHSGTRSSDERQAK